MTEAEKRERRALERKLSEMEEELKVSNYWFFHFFFLELRKGFCWIWGIFFSKQDLLLHFWHLFFSASQQNMESFLF
jgi:hypothetical protein